MKDMKQRVERQIEQLELQIESTSEDLAGRIKWLAEDAAKAVKDLTSDFEPTMPSTKETYAASSVATSNHQSEIVRLKAILETQVRYMHDLRYLLED